MPQKTRQKNTARRNGKSVRTRKVKPFVRRKEITGKSKDATRLAAGSLFTLTLTPKRGFEITEENWNVFDAPVSEVTRNLLACVNRARLLLFNEAPLKFEKGTNNDSIMKAVIGEFEKRILPKGYKYNIDVDGTGPHFFTVYKCVEFQQAWHHFEMRPMVNYLAKKDTRLLKLFYSVIHALSAIAGINTWYNGNLYAMDMLINDEMFLTDHIENIVDELDTDEQKEAYLKEWEETVADYKKGEARKCQRQIEAARTNLKFIEAGLNKYQGKNPAAVWMRQALDFIADGQCIENYKYVFTDHNGYADDGYLRLEDQVTIIWCTDDKVYDITCEYMDNDAANFGVEDPFVNFPITASNRFIPLDKLTVAENWMKKLTALFTSYYKLIQQIKK